MRAAFEASVPVTIHRFGREREFGMHPARTHNGDGERHKLTGAIAAAPHRLVLYRAACSIRA